MRKDHSVSESTTEAKPHQMSSSSQQQASASDASNDTSKANQQPAKMHASRKAATLKKAHQKPKSLTSNSGKLKTPKSAKASNRAGKKGSESSGTRSSSNKNASHDAPLSPRRHLSPSQQRSVDKLAQPRRTRSKRYKLEKSHSKSGFGSGSARDLFFGMIPKEGAKKIYLQHEELTQHNAAQSAFKSTSFIKERPAITNNNETKDVDLQHSEQILEHHDTPKEHSAPFGTTEEKFKQYDYYHSRSGTNEMIAPGSYFQEQNVGDQSRRNSGAFIDLSEGTPNKHPSAVLFLQQHKHFRSSNDMLEFAALKASKNGGSSLSRMGGKVSQSTMALPLHLIKKGSKNSSKSSSREGSNLTSPRMKSGALVSPRRRAKRPRKKAQDTSPTPLTPITPLTSSSDSDTMEFPQAE
mmetsp:Transcript_995/g.3431  ORF Transcript_995/g.3431 Transcript_995/m.3431 type:complete len:410 (-) Transcript_995:1225-2454(-)|eukprot:CAMPEP_0117441954 /NCGR_PEP_ID=MMETSP0759-20121206/3899_1 /TAXON_ID=63605 /ORGANISM="Percolomonas cosmopolitus, Strain WS" /LENGTH=409 /DNA_ID=CAMNT_0005233821 /DNA_START=412 /DNA_END=1641 /DNA_ORIENTATION=-